MWLDSFAGYKVGDKVKILSVEIPRDMKHLIGQIGTILKIHDFGTTHPFVISFENGQQWVFELKEIKPFQKDESYFRVKKQGIIEKMEKVKAEFVEYEKEYKEFITGKFEKGEGHAS